jgi:AraC family transcriptional regulator
LLFCKIPQKLLGSKYEHAGGLELEIYLPGDPSEEDYKCEVWIPIIEKA